jgi:sterol O-acyltransferase
MSGIDGRIRWDYIAEKTAATLGSIGLMIVITEHYVLPVVQPILPSETAGMLFSQKVGELGWVLLDMVFPYRSPRPTSAYFCVWC